MKHQKISDKYCKWIIEYYSDRFSKPMFFIWLTDVSDKEEKDQILITGSEKIIVAASKKKLIKKVLKSKIQLPDSKRTRKWLSKSLKSNKLSSIKFDLRGVETKVLSKKLKSKEIEEVVNFINLFEDYQTQNKQTEQKSRTKELDILWNYYYDQIFWPNFNGDNQKKYQRSKLKINDKKLLKELSSIVSCFENRFDH